MLNNNDESQLKKCYSIIKGIEIDLPMLCDMESVLIRDDIVHHKKIKQIM